MMFRRQTSTRAIVAALAFSAGGAACAQDSTVTLKSQDQAVNLTGELVSFEDDVYLIRTNLGTLRISADRVSCEGAGCPQPVQAQAAAFTPGVVTIKATSGATELTGMLVNVEDGVYTLETDFGVLQIPSADSVCIGDSCPVDRVASKDIAIFSSRELSSGLVASLVAGFAEFKNTSLTGRPVTEDETELKLASADGEAFANVTLAASNDTQGVEELIAGRADLLATRRAAGGAEGFAAASRGNGDGQTGKSTVIALDALAIAVSPENPLRAISEDDIARVFSGQITDWAELGGEPGPINLYVLSEDNASVELFNALVMSPTGASFNATANVVDTEAALAESVANDPRGIGFASYSRISNAKPLAVRGACGIQVPANDFTIKTEEYPLVGRIYMHKPDNTIPQAATDFVDFINSETAQTIVKAQGYVGQDVTSVSVNEQGLRFISTMLPSDVDVSYGQLQEMVRELAGADRLSLTFRFEPGSARLDTRAESDVLRLAEMIQSGTLSNKELIIAGFTDSSGVGETNLSLSQARAEQVRNAVLDAAGLSGSDDLPVRAVGYGEMSPLGCNDSLNGRGINRRVEVWLKDAYSARTN